MSHGYEDIEAALRSIATETPASKGLGGHFTRLKREHPERLAVATTLERRSFAEVESSANRLARSLEALGVGPGRHLAVVLPNSVAFIEVVVAAWKLGATPTPISYRLPSRELEELLDLAGPTVTVVDRLEEGAQGSVAISELLDDASTRSDAPLPDIETIPWKAIPSGGSTGRSKLIIDRGSGPMSSGVSRLFGMRPGGLELIAGPLYHNGPFAWGFIQLMAGGGLYIMGRFDAEGYLAAIERERITWSFVVPTMLHRLVQLPEATLRRYDLSSLDVVLHSAAPCPAWLKRKAIDLFGAKRVWEYYGATEAPGTMIRGDDWLRHPGSVGRALPTVELEIWAEDGHPLRPGEVGEVWLRPSTGLTFSYKGAEERIQDGAVSVGDLGYLDEDGYLYLSDRRTDMIITGGANVYPAEVEAVILEHPLVDDCAVVGLADPEWGQRVHAIVQPGGHLSAEDLDPFCRERLASHKAPKTFELVDLLPRDPSGKIRRSALRAEREPASPA